MAKRCKKLLPIEWFAIAASALIICFIVIDPLILAAIKDLDPDVTSFFKEITHLGRASWILFPIGTAAIVLLGLRIRENGKRTAAAYAYSAQLCAFVFACVAGAGIFSSLTKNILGRARPKLFDAVGSLEFEPFTFHADFASFPSGHATTIFAFAAAMAVLVPKLRVLLFVIAGWVAASRFLIGAHFFSDAVAGSIVGLVFTRFLIERMAARRWLFQYSQDGRIEMRGRTLGPWITEQFRMKLASK